MSIFLVFAAACEPPSQTTPLAPPTAVTFTPTTPSDSGLHTHTTPIDTGPQLPSFRTLVGLHVVPDMTGDAEPDLIVETVDVRALVLVPGPFSDRDTLDLEVDAAAVVYVDAKKSLRFDLGDVDGDGLTDIVAQLQGKWSESDRFVTRAPLQTTQGLSDGPSYDGFAAVDLEGDGVLERIRYDPLEEVLEVFAPSLSGGTPLLSVDPGCVPTSTAWTAQTFPDLDGDGVRELFVHGPGPCGSLWVDATARGEVAAADITRRADLPTGVVGNVTGDEHVDAVVADELVAGPLDLSKGSPQGAGSSIRWFDTLRRVPFDLNQDGLGEFEIHAGHVRRIVSVAAGIHWDLVELPGRPGPAVWVAYTVEDGHAVVLSITADDTISVEQLDPATAVGLHE